MPAGYRPVACDMLVFLTAVDALPLDADAPAHYTYLGNWVSETAAARTFPANPRVPSGATHTVHPPSTPQRWWEVGPCAALLLREVEWVRWNLDMLFPDKSVVPADLPARSDADPDDDDDDEDYGETLAFLGPPPPFGARPPADGNIPHLRHIYDVADWHAKTALLGPVPRQCPLSVQAPGCASNILAHCHSPPRFARIVAAARLGLDTMCAWPWAGADSVPFNASGAVTETGDAAASTAARRKASTKYCRLCGTCSDARRAGLYHYAVECPHASLVAFRLQLQRAAVDQLERMTALCAAHVERHAAPLPPAGGGADRRYRVHMAALHERFQRLRTAFPLARGTIASNGGNAAHPAPGGWDNPLVRTLVYRVLTVQPFSALSVPGGAAAPQLVRAAGAFFDAATLPSAALRPIVTRWVNWAARRILRLASIVTTQTARVRAVARAAAGVDADADSDEEGDGDNGGAASTSPSLRGRRGTSPASASSRRSRSVSPNLRGQRGRSTSPQLPGSRTARR